MIKMIDEQNYGLTKEVELEELNEHLRSRCEDYLKRNKNKDIVIDAFGNINCEKCNDCNDCNDCHECVGCNACTKCAYCEYLSFESGAIYKSSALDKKRALAARIKK